MSRTHDTIISSFDLDRLETELDNVTDQRDCAIRILKRVQEQCDELKEDRDAWKSEALIMDARLRGVKHPNDNGIFSPDEVIPKLEREIASVKEQRDRLAEELNEIKEEYGTWWAQKRIAIDELKDVTEQRDRLAEALRVVIADYRLDGRVSAEADMLASEALAAVKGGSDE
ncbi:MAG: hypothetical protein ACK5H0_10290 [Bacteroidota bacterium]|jgi:uncharacterized coiled-coil DUF342 family protein